MKHRYTLWYQKDKIRLQIGNNMNCLQWIFLFYIRSREGAVASSSLRPLLLAQCRASGMKDPLSLGPEAHRWSLWRSLAPEFPLRLPGPSDELPASSLAPPGLCSAHVPSSCFLGSDCSAVQSYEWVTRGLHLGFGFCCVPALPAVRGTPCQLADACLSSCLSPSCPH